MVPALQISTDPTLILAVIWTSIPGRYPVEAAYSSYLVGPVTSGCLAELCGSQ